MMCLMITAWIWPAHDSPPVICSLRKLQASAAGGRNSSGLDLPEILQCGGLEPVQVRGKARCGMQRSK